jgi:hypothetical protein
MMYQHIDCIDFEVINRFVLYSSPKNYYAKGLRNLNSLDRFLKTLKYQISLITVRFEAALLHTHRQADRPIDKTWPVNYHISQFLRRRLKELTKRRQ